MPGAVLPGGVSGGARVLGNGERLGGMRLPPGRFSCTALLLRRGRLANLDRGDTLRSGLVRRRRGAFRRTDNYRKTIGAIVKSGPEG
jgi:hypothetical protein